MCKEIWMKISPSIILSNSETFIIYIDNIWVWSKTVHEFCDHFQSWISFFVVDRHSCIPQDSFTLCPSSNETILLKHESSMAKKSGKKVNLPSALSVRFKFYVMYLAKGNEISIFNKCSRVSINDLTKFWNQFAWLSFPN